MNYYPIVTKCWKNLALSGNRTQRLQNTVLMLYRLSYRGLWELFHSMRNYFQLCDYWIIVHSPWVNVYKCDLFIFFPTAFKISYHQDMFFKNMQANFKVFENKLPIFFSWFNFSFLVFSCQQNSRRQFSKYLNFWIWIFR